MPKNPIIINENSSMHEALNLILSTDISRLIVVSDGKIVGTITTTDLLYLAPVLKMKEVNVKVKEVMTPTIVIVDEYEDLNYAARLMANRKVKGLPVVGVSGELKGILTTTDIVRALTDEKTRKYLLELKLYTTTF
jgi:Predicted transcriptional regulator, contains C-terminal CBS domains